MAKQTVNLQGGGCAGEGGQSLADYDGDGYADYVFTSSYTDAQSNSYLVLDVLSGGAAGLSNVVAEHNTSVLFQPGPFGGLTSCDVNGAYGYADLLEHDLHGRLLGTISAFFGSAAGLTRQTRPR